MVVNCTLIYLHAILYEVMYLPLKCARIEHNFAVLWLTSICQGILLYCPMEFGEIQNKLKILSMVSVSRISSQSTVKMLHHSLKKFCSNLSFLLYIRLLHVFNDAPLLGTHLTYSIRCHIILQIRCKLRPIILYSAGQC